MNEDLRGKLILKAEEHCTKGDPSHDFQHLLRVLHLAEQIAREEKADLDIIVPAALFHDIVIYPKNSPESKNEALESAALAERVLGEISEYPQDKVELVGICIKQCSFSKGIVPELLEARVLQDADRLEATGAISIMRTFSSGGQMKRPFYNDKDPFREKSEPEDYTNGLDLFFKRLLVVEEKMYTKLAKKMAKRRTEFLRTFLSELKMELQESKIIE